MALAQDLAEASEALALDLATEALALAMDLESSGSDDRILRHKLCNQLDLQGKSVCTHPSTLLGIQELGMEKVALGLGLAALDLVVALPPTHSQHQDQSSTSPHLILASIHCCLSPTCSPRNQQLKYTAGNNRHNCW